MTVEQRIYEEGREHPVETKRIAPGHVDSINLVGVENPLIDDDHFKTGKSSENPMTFVVSCADDDSEGLISFEHPPTGEIRYQHFSEYDSPFYMVRMPNGRLGMIEWTHKKTG